VVATAFAVYQAHVSPLTYFYDPAARAWELLVGACVAEWHLTHKGRTFTFGKFTIAINATALLILTYFLFTPQALSPYSVLGALPVIVAGLAILLAPAQYKYLLPMAFIGEISFTLYLVHWPIINLIDNKITHHTWRSTLLILVLIAIFTLLLHYLIENPARFKLSSRTIVATSLAGSIALIAATMGVANTSWAAPKAAITMDLSTPAVYQNGCHLDGSTTWPGEPCTFGDIKGSQRWLLIGDSHAAQWFPAFSIIATRNHIALTSITRSSCPALYLATIRYEQVDGACQIFQHKLALYISTHHFDKVFISNFTRQAYQLVNNNTNIRDQWIQGTKEFLIDAKLNAHQVVFMQDTPLSNTNSVACLTGQPKNVGACNFTLSSDATYNALKTYALQNKYSVLLTDHWLCTAGKCFAEFNGHNTYRDATHIAVSTAQELEPKLAQYFHFHS
jgi:hypothetical protein